MVMTPESHADRYWLPLRTEPMRWRSPRVKVSRGAGVVEVRFMTPLLPQLGTPGVFLSPPRVTAFTANGRSSCQVSSLPAIGFLSRPLDRTCPRSRGSPRKKPFFGIGTVDVTEKKLLCSRRSNAGFIFLVFEKRGVPACLVQN